MKTFYAVLLGLVGYVLAHILLEAIKKPDDGKAKREAAYRQAAETRAMYRTK